MTRDITLFRALYRNTVIPCVIQYHVAPQSAILQTRLEVDY